MTMIADNLPQAGSPPLADRLVLADGERWYVVITQPRAERYAALNLNNQGYRCFLPQHVVTRRHARQFRTAWVAVFPRYLFVILCVQKGRWRSVNGTLGVRGLISQGDFPLPVRPGVVETLVQSSGAGGRLRYEDDPLAPGDKVRLVSGPFAGSLGILQSLDAAGRVRLLLALVGGSVMLTTRRNAVEAVG